MGLKSGALLWRRQRITIPPTGAGLGTLFDTGLKQPNHSFPDYSPGEPPLGVVTSPPGPSPGALPASRIQVIPLAPLVTAWDLVQHGEPFVDPATGTVNVLFQNLGVLDVTVNVLFWDPHSIGGPGLADTYNP